MPLDVHPGVSARPPDSPFSYFLFSLLMVGLAYAPWPMGMILPKYYLTASLAAGCVCLVSLLGLAMRQRSWSIPNVGLSRLVMVGVIALFLIQWLVSVDRYQATVEIFRLGTVVIVAMFFYYFGAAAGLVRPFLSALIAIGVFYAVYGMAQATGAFDHSYWAQPFQVSSRLVNSTHFAGFLLMPLMAGLGLLFSSAAWPWKVLPILSLPVLGKAMLMTKSRSGWLCFVLCVLVYLWLMGKEKWKALSVVSKSVVVMALVCALAGVVYSVHDEIYQRIAVLAPTHFQTLTQRFEVWVTSFLVLLHYPLGVGAGNLWRVSSQFKIVCDRFLIDYSHNEFLQIAIEYGILGLGIVFALIVLYQKRMERFFQALPKRPGEISVAAGLYAAVLGVATQSLVDFPLRIPSTALIFFATLGFQLGMAGVCGRETVADVQKSPSWRFAWQGKACFSLLLLGCAWFVGEAARLSAAERWLALARREAKNFSWSEAVNAYQKGSRLAPSSGQFQRDWGQLLMQRSILAKDKLPLLSEAAGVLEKALAKSPRDRATQWDLAKVYAMLGRNEEAECMYKLALVAGPQGKGPHMRLGYFLMQQGMLDQGARFLRFAELLPCCEEPQWTLDPTMERFMARARTVSLGS